MLSIQDQGRSMLKIAQFKKYRERPFRGRKYIELIFQNLDPNLKISSTDLLGNCGKYLIGDSLLHVVYAQNSVDALDFLIHKGADLNVKNKEDNTVLHMAYYYLLSDYKRSRWNILQKNLYTRNEKSQFITSILSAQVKYENAENPCDPGGLTYFHVACATNNVEAVEFFLKSGVSVDQIVAKAISNQDFTGYTGLHFAAQFGCLEVIEILLEQGANGNLADAQGRTPLHIALERSIAMIDSAEEIYSHQDIERNEKVMQLLIDRDCIENFSYLYIASSLQSTTSLENYLTQELRSEVRTITVNQCISMDSLNWPGYTALHFAAHIDVKMVKLLMKYGGNMEAKNANGVTPFDMCVQRYQAEDIANIVRLVPSWENIVMSDGKTKLIDLLLAFDDPDDMQIFLEKSDQNTELFVPFDSPLWPSFTILHIAVLLTERKECKSDYKRGETAQFDPDLTVITEILKQGADVTIKNSRNWTPIHYAFQLGREKVLNLLLKYHYRMLNPVDDANLSHLHIACSVKNENFIERLLLNNVDVNIPYKGETKYSNVSPGSTPLHIALFEGEGKIAKLLLKFGADLHIPDAHSFTPLHFSMHEDYWTPRMRNRILFSPLFSDHVVESVGLSYLHVASHIPNLDAVKRLLDLGVDVNQRITVEKSDKDGGYSEIWDLENRNGDTPLHIAVNSINCSADVVSLLIERGADILARNAAGECPLDEILDFYNEERLQTLVGILKRDVDLRRRVEVETGITLLHVACLLDDDNLVKELLDDGYDITAQIPEDKMVWPGYSSLHVAYDKLHSSSRDDWLSMMTRVSLLLKAHKNFHVNPMNPRGISHFHVACHMLDVEVVKKFLKHGVDVNASIDVFCNVAIAGCSPLLLATRTTNWRDSDSAKPLIESSAKLKIVELLIKHGARVNVEDIDGNTPAHYAASCSSKDENYLKLLVDNGADVNTRNVRGKTPLELLIRKEDLEFEDIRYFIACGCIFNDFTLDTEEGYIALANTMIFQDDMESLLQEIFANYSNSMRRDSMNRTPIHNLLSTRHYKTNTMYLATIVDVLMRFNCDADDQDNLGRTALHLAARFRNDIGVEAMLLVGADFSITDNNGKMPFTYMFAPCLCSNNDSFHKVYGHSQMMDVFMSHVRKMEISKLNVDKLNMIHYNASGGTFGFERMSEILQNFYSEFPRMMKLKIEPYSILLADFTSRADAVFEYPRMSEAKRDAIDAFFKRNKNVFRNKCPNAAGIFQLQYRQAVLRRKMMVVAKDSLSVLMKFQVPDTCSDVILRFLENCELRNLIASTKCVESRSVGGDSDSVFRSNKPRL